MGKQWRLIPLFIFLIVVFSLNENPFRKQLASPSPPSIPASFKVEKWRQQLGQKIITLRQAIPTEKRVILVPDEATFLNAIQQWNLQRRYPILIEDDYYTPRFLRRFQPEEVIRLSSIKETPSNRKDTMRKAVAAAWESEAETLSQTWENLGWNPPGVVITSVNDPASVAAVALAADRGQPLLFLEDYFGGVNQTLNSEQWQTLNQQVNDLIASTEYEYESLGDTIDTITLARTIPAKYKSPENDDLLAVTDGLGRNEEGNRYAITGWIYGSPERAAYQAMSAIFLPQETALLYDSYPQTENWEAYHFQESLPTLEEKSLEVKHIKHANASKETWQEISNESWDYDLAFINSRGGKANFSVGNGSASVEDIPNLNVPTAMHMIHSFSATTPDDINTVAGRWLNNGVYAYVGAVDEPYVSGFVPPQYIISQLSLNVPFLVASRYSNSPTWKVTTIGDPLMVIHEDIEYNKKP
ncbi:MAG: hypothetical protein ACLFRN_09015 [Halothece sp.]